MMFEVQKTEEFDEWLSDLEDQKAKAKIVSRIERLDLGNPGDVKPVGQGVSEMRVPPWPGLPRLLQADRKNHRASLVR
jgi:putative addiction module killer protein